MKIEEQNEEEADYEEEFQKAESLENFKNEDKNKNIFEG